MNLLDTLYDTGEALCAALEGEDFDHAAALFTTRAEQLATLHTYPNPAALGPGWEADGHRLREQDARIREALDLASDDLLDELRRAERQRTAQRSYSAPPLQTARIASLQV